MTERQERRFDLIVVLLLPILATVMSFALTANSFVSVILFFGLPALYLTARAPQYSKKAVLFALPVGVGSIITLDWIAHLTGTWVNLQSILPVRLFDFVSLEVLLWAFLHIYLIVLFYEHFLNHHVSPAWSRKMRTLTTIIGGILFVFLVLLAAAPHLLNIPYFYLVFGTTLIFLPVVLELSHHSRLIGKFFKVAAYFFFLTFLYEIAALQLGWWIFPSSQFIGYVEIASVKFPFEEFFFWFLLLAMAVLSYYEAFDDDQK